MKKTSSEKGLEAGPWTSCCKTAAAMCKPPKPSQRNKRAGERATPRRGTQTGNCQTGQRNRRAEGRAPRSSTQTSSFRKVQGQRRALESRERTGSCQAISGNHPGKRSSGWELDENEQRWSAGAKAYLYMDYLYMVTVFSWWSNLDDHEIPFTMYFITYTW